MNVSTGTAGCRRRGVASSGSARSHPLVRGSENLGVPRLPLGRAVGLLRELKNSIVVAAQQATLLAKPQQPAGSTWQPSSLQRN